MNKIINCLEIADSFYQEIITKLQRLKTKNIIPNFATILVGNNPASKIYVTNKAKKSTAIGINNIIYNFEENIREEELLKVIGTLNKDKNVDGILIQMPLPQHINTNKVLQSVDYNKDIDGLHPYNQGLLMLERNRGYIDNNRCNGLVPCTPMGCTYLLNQLKITLENKRVVVMGRSNLVGLPLMQLLLNSNCSVEVVHAKTNNIKSITKQADILVVAIGQPQLIDNSYIKAGAIVLDVGINRLNGKIVGDVNTPLVLDQVQYITPVPKGIGALTIASLMSNVVKVAEKRF